MLSFYLSGVQQSFRGPLVPVLHSVLDDFEEVGLDVVVNLQHAGVHDAHVHARLNGVVQEHRVH